MTGNIWRSITYYWRRKKIYRSDGTVLMASIRTYELLDRAQNGKAAGKLLRWPVPAIPTSAAKPAGRSASPRPFGLGARLQELYVAIRRSPTKQVPPKGRLRNASIR
jgi:hypothetical protein